jgi:hypothetical protein
MIHCPARPRTACAILLLVVCASAASADRPAGSGGLVRVRASVAFSPSLAPVLAAFSRETGIETLLEEAEPDPPGDADLVVGDDSETTRLLESGRADLGSALDLGYLPWVFVAPTGAPTNVLSAASASETGISVLGGAAGREARALLRGVPPSRLRLTTNGDELRRAPMALVPSSLAGPGEHRLSTLRPLLATAALIPDTASAGDARRLLAFLRGGKARALLSRSLTAKVSSDATRAINGVFASAIIDYWEPACSLGENFYVDPQAIIGPPDSVYLGTKDYYTGMMSLGQGGWVVLEMAQPVVDGPGPDVRVYQVTGDEPVTLYASNQPAGPWTLVGLRESCGLRSPGGIAANHCDFDLQGTGLPSALYLKIEDGEIYPCLAGTTHTEGADIDAVEALNH